MKILIFIAGLSKNLTEGTFFTEMIRPSAGDTISLSPGGANPFGVAEKVADQKGEGQEQEAHDRPAKHRSDQRGKHCRKDKRYPFAAQSVHAVAFP